MIKLSLIGFCILLFLLLIFMQFCSPKIFNINELNEKQLNKQISVSGKIISTKSYQESNFQIISLKDSTGEIDITLMQILDVSNITQIKVIGKLTKYNNKFQIQAEKILK